MIRLATYVMSCAVVGVVLWWMAATKPYGLMVGLWAVAWAVGLAVTWRVARRENRSPIAWLVVAFLIGPLAWIALAMRPPGADRS